MILALIAALARNGVIGRDGALPWHLPADLKRFRELTRGHHVIMGRGTYVSIGRPLPDRVNIVLSRQPAYEAPGCSVVPGLGEALAQARQAGETEAFVIGGAAVYESALPEADRLFLTRVDADVAGDAVFPELDQSQWRLASSEEHAADETHAHAFAFTVCERIRT